MDWLHICTILIFVTTTFSNAGKVEDIFLSPTGNSIISPLSVCSTLYPLQLGSDGATKLELSEFLKSEFYSIDDENSASTQSLQLLSPQINSVTALFTSLPLAQRYIKAATTGSSKTKVHLYENFNFTKSFNDINELVRSSTNGLINDIIQPESVNERTKLIVINAVYFKAKWRQPFEPIPDLQPFYSTKTSVSRVAMMTQRSTNYYAEVPELQSRVVEIPYENGDFAMRVILPFENNGLSKVLELLKTFDYNKLRLKLTEVDITLPKFRISNELELDKHLKNNGLSTLFSPTKANLTKLTVQGRYSNEENLFVDKLITKAVLDVSPLGTEGGSATAAFIIPLSGLQSFDEFVADHPFAFQILSPKDKTTIFAGTLIQPPMPQVQSANNNGSGNRNGGVPNKIKHVHPPLPELQDVSKEEVKQINNATKSPTSLTHQLTFYQLNKNKIPTTQQSSIEAPITVAMNETNQTPPWWVHTGKPEYLLMKTLSQSELTKQAPTTPLPRFQQPEPAHPTGIRFPYPLTDPTTQFVLQTHQRNSSTTNAI